MDDFYNAKKIKWLILKEKFGEISSEEKAELQKWTEENNSNAELYKKLTNDKYVSEKISKYEKINKKDAWAKISQQTVYSEKKLFIKYMKYAAAILIPIAFFIFIYNAQNKKGKAIIAEQTMDTIESLYKKATLITSQGEEITLNADVKNIRHSKFVKITNDSSELAYFEQEASAQIAEPIIHTLITPRGGEYSLKLADGTKVWLNADSKIVFPEVFSDSIRKVNLEGEAYFEVAENKEKPFIVATDIVDIKVLGTGFNVAAYTDEEEIVTTLVHGKVEVADNQNPKNKTLLLPSKQATAKRNNHKISTKTVDTDEFTAWKEGRFVFKDQALKDLMKKLIRWYDVDVQYKDEGLESKHFTGSIKKYTKIEDILDLIKATTDINYTKKGNSIIITK